MTDNKNTPTKEPETPDNTPPRRLMPEDFVYTIHDAVGLMQDALIAPGRIEERLCNQAGMLDHIFTILLSQAVESTPHGQLTGLTLDRDLFALAMQVQKQCVETARVSGGLSYTRTLEDQIAEKSFQNRLANRPHPIIEERNEGFDDV